MSLSCNYCNLGLPMSHSTVCIKCTRYYNMFVNNFDIVHRDMFEKVNPDIQFQARNKSLAVMYKNEIVLV